MVRCSVLCDFSVVCRLVWDCCIVLINDRLCVFSVFVVVVSVCWLCFISVVLMLFWCVSVFC